MRRGVDNTQGCRFTASHDANIEVRLHWLFLFINFAWILDIVLLTYVMLTPLCTLLILERIVGIKMNTALSEPLKRHRK